ncbi:MAG: HAD family phosphatase [Chlamydiia bacterium]|nr:HAD family phosphatase [Chlamydiia bacterium]
MHWILKHSPIFFDFDGLLVDTEELHFQAYVEMMKRHGVFLPWDFTTFASIAHKSSEGLRLAITSLAPKLVESLSWETLYDHKKEAYMALLERGNLKLMEGAEEILNMVQKANIPHAVVTNSTRTQTEMIRKNLPLLNRVPHWITREDYEKAKPSPDAYLKAIEVLGHSDTMLGFEDTLRGIRALEGAKITPVLIAPLDHPQMKEIPEGSLKHYSSFRDILRCYTSCDKNV